ncbi:hypothetical protein D9M70_532280 [compost metagenome]
MPPPTTSAARINARPLPVLPASPAPAPASNSFFSFRISATVVSAATSMPAMPKALPRRAVVGCDSPFNAWIKHTDAPR